MRSPALWGRARPCTTVLGSTRRVESEKKSMRPAL